MAEGAQGECRWSEGVQEYVQSNVQAAVQGQNRLDIFRGPRGGYQRVVCIAVHGKFGGRRARNV